MTPAELRQYSHFGLEVIYDAPVPELTVSPAAVLRGGSATFTVTNATGATISDWKFTPSGESPIVRGTNPAATSWGGQFAEGGTATVTVVKGGVTYNLSKAITVSSRGWSTAVLPTQKVPNGTFSTLISPPVSNSDMGQMNLRLLYSFTPHSIADNGPNHGFKLVLSVDKDPTASYRWQLVEDLNRNSAFFRAQCGNYHPQSNPNGFIEGVVLRWNGIEHESGTVMGHYAQYSTTLADPSNNFGVLAESLTAPPEIPLATFQQTTNQLLSDASARILSATSFEACNADFRRGAPTCAFQGWVNYLPYKKC